MTYNIKVLLLFEKSTFTIASLQNYSKIKAIYRTYILSDLPINFFFGTNSFLFIFQVRRQKAIAEDPAIAAEAIKQPPEEDDEKDEIDDEIVITHL